LYDILGRFSGELPLEIPLIISNHGWRKRGGFSFLFRFIMFLLLKISKPKVKQNNWIYWKQYNIDFYCFGTLHAIITNLIAQYKNQIINIHLPSSSVSGAKPYHSAFKRG
jgi:formyltetrahydrofolate hydrolase